VQPAQVQVQELPAPRLPEEQVVMAPQIWMAAAAAVAAGGPAAAAAALMRVVAVQDQTIQVVQV